MAFEIIQIPRDDASIRSYVEQYKNFRLYSLKAAPECFGSTYAREIAFTDDVWYDRLANPKATTFVAMQSDRIVCTLTAIGPLPFLAEEYEEYVFHAGCILFCPYLWTRAMGEVSRTTNFPCVILVQPVIVTSAFKNLISRPDRLHQQIRGKQAVVKELKHFHNTTCVSTECSHFPRLVDKALRKHCLRSVWRTGLRKQGMLEWPLLRVSWWTMTTLQPEPYIRSVDLWQFPRSLYLLKATG